MLLHICCAPCSIETINYFKLEGNEITGYWYNPNIHPYTEYAARKACLEEYAKQINLKVIYEDVYGLTDFILGTAGNLNDRCGFCYDIRFRKAAAFAAENGYDAFSTTLSVSPYQKHGVIIESAERASEKCGVPFIYADLRPHFRNGRDEARKSGLYMQKYCGCIFSEAERYGRLDDVAM